MLKINMNKFKKYIIFLMGTIIFSFGVTLGNKSLFGGNCMAVFVVGVHKHTPLTIGTCNLLVAIVEVIIGFFTDRKNITWATVISMFTVSYVMDFSNTLIADTNDLVTRAMYMMVGIVLYCFGFGMQQSVEIGYGNLDVFVFGLKKVFNISKYHTIKWILDAIFFTIGYFLGAEVGIGTLLLLLFTGLLIEKSRDISIKIFNIK